MLGLEAAWELRKAGIEVTVLELAPKLMGRQLDDQAAALLLDACGKSRVRVETGVQIQSIRAARPSPAWSWAAARSSPAQLVVVSAGVRANTAIAQSAGIEIDRAIVVNERMETNLPGVYACGDCAQYQGINYALWPEAQEQGKTAGACAAGELAAYQPIAPVLAFHGMGTELFSPGRPRQAARCGVQDGGGRDEARNTLERYYFTAGKLCGVILAGDLSKMADMMAAIDEKRSFAEFFA